MGIERDANESALAYHRRLINGKLVDKTLADIDYTELAEALYGKPYSSDVARRMIYGSKKTLDLMEESVEETAPADIISDLDRQKIELQIERQKYYDQRREYKKLLTTRARQEELNEIISSYIKSGDLPVLTFNAGKVMEAIGDNDLLVSLNDIHYGANVDNYWRKYNSDVCRDMFESYLSDIIKIGETHHSKNCYVWCNGDEISGNIHYRIAVSNKENVIQQIMGVSELIAEFLSVLSSHFTNVVFVSVAGNHSRLNPNKDMSVPDERLDDLVGWYLSGRLQNFDNIIINGEHKIDSTMYTIDIRGKTYCGVHGDFDATSANIQTLQSMVNKPVYAVLSGHMHHNKIDDVQGIKTIMAGSFMGMDDYCVQKRIVGKPQQLVCVCDDTGVRCYYDIIF